MTVAHLGSASGAFVPALSAPGRVILAASAAHETNETRFAEHFIAAFSNEDSGGGADRNKDGRLSALEAFDFARLGVEREYDERGLLRTEHPLLDDNGDGVGSLDPAAAPGSDGVLAARRSLLFRTAEAAGEAAPEGADPELRALIAERDELAARVDALREVRESMDEEAYLAELENAAPPDRRNRGADRGDPGADGGSSLMDRAAGAAACALSGGAAPRGRGRGRRAPSGPARRGWRRKSPAGPAVRPPPRRSFGRGATRRPSAITGRP